MRKARILLAAAVVATTLAGGLLAGSRNDTAEAAAGPITWSDEFNGAAGSAIDSSRWKFDIGGSGWGNNELEYYTSSTSNVYQDGQGHLAITARKENPASYQCHYGTCQYTSGRILTADKFSQTYGRFEASIKIPKGQGSWPAFWMLGGNNWPTTGEIDIMENVGSAPNTVYGTIHTRPAGRAGQRHRIQLVTCNGNPVQRFTLSSSGDLVNVSANRCVDIKDWNSANGAGLQLWDCAGTSNQKWTRGRRRLSTGG